MNVNVVDPVYVMTTDQPSLELGAIAADLARPARGVEVGEETLLEVGQSLTDLGDVVRHDEWSPSLAGVDDPTSPGDALDGARVTGLAPTGTEAVATGPAATPGA